MIKRGPKNNQRLHARNFTQKQAQARLEETVKPFNNQVQNALDVDAVEVVIYQVNRLIGKPCSCGFCNEAQMPGETMAPVVPQEDRVVGGIELEMQDDDIFGSSLSEKIMNDSNVIDVSGGRGDDGVIGTMERDNDDDDYQSGIAQGSVNCGICYRTLRVPGYKPMSMHRQLFTHYDIDGVDGYSVDPTSAPAAMNKEVFDDGSYVRFRLLVPKYFVSCTYSIRDNLYIVREKPFRADGAIITIADLRRFAGREMEFFIKAETFTHVTFEFDLGVPRFRANIGGENTTLDYDRLQTMSDIPVVLGPEVSEMNEGDIICIPERGLFLKVRDKERKITSHQRRLEWVLSTRVLQPTEPLINISKGYKLR